MDMQSIKIRIALLILTIDKAVEMIKKKKKKNKEYPFEKRIKCRMNLKLIAKKLFSGKVSLTVVVQ